jgi:DNA-binding protein H-NS
MFNETFSIINNIGLVLLAVSPTVFIFSVTLLGDVLEKSQQEENAARQNEKETISKRIAKTEATLKRAKQDGNIEELEGQLAALKKDSGVTDKQIRRIKHKYSRVNFENTVVLPCTAFLLLMLVGVIGGLLGHHNYVNGYLLVILQVVLLVYGGTKLFLTLNLVQYIIATKDRNEPYARLRETIKTAMTEYYQGMKEDVKFEFTNVTFPMNVAAGMELSIKFRVSLVKGSVLRDAYVWFFVADGFTLVDPPEEKSWQQGTNYNPPNIRTVKISLGNVSIGPYTPGTLKVITPTNSGKYLLRYAVRAEGFSGSSTDVTVLVN